MIYNISLFVFIEKNKMYFCSLNMILYYYVTFVYTFHMIYLGILEFINNILTNGFVPSLYLDQKENLEMVQRFKDININTSSEITT